MFSILKKAVPESSAERPIHLCYVRRNSVTCAAFFDCVKIVFHKKTNIFLAWVYYT